MASETQAHDAHEHGHFGPEMWVIPGPTSLAADVVERQRSSSPLFSAMLYVGGLLTVLGIVGFVMRLTLSGFSDHQAWGFYVAAFTFVFTLTSSAPLAACAFRFTKSHWRRPLTRVSELFALVSVINILLLIPALIALPDILNPIGASNEALDIRRTIWFRVPFGAPVGWHLAAMVGLAVTSLSILWLSAMPDMAQTRAQMTGFRAALYRTLAGRWYGTKRQWQVQKAGLAMLGAFYFMLLVFVQFIIVSDFAMSLIPGWKDSILPPFYTVISFQSGLALIMVVGYAMRRWGGYRELIGQAPFWAASKVLLGLTLLHTYHLFAFFITYWYGRLEVELNILNYLMFDSYLGIFWAQLFFTFFIPFPILLSNHARRSGWGAPLAGVFILIGLMLFHIRIFAAAFASSDGESLYHFFILSVPPARMPELWDIFLILGAFGIVMAVFRLGMMLIPPMSVWEMKEGAMYQRIDTLIRGRYLVLGKPE
jgi:molybdopterin-containing oxidoreductase family membrane subunit